MKTISQTNPSRCIAVHTLLTHAKGLYEMAMRVSINARRLTAVGILALLLISIAISAPTTANGPTTATEGEQGGELLFEITHLYTAEYKRRYEAKPPEKSRFLSGECVAVVFYVMCNRRALEKVTPVYTSALVKIMAPSGKVVFLGSSDDGFGEEDEKMWRGYAWAWWRVPSDAETREYTVTLEFTCRRWWMKDDKYSGSISKTTDFWVQAYKPLPEKEPSYFEEIERERLKRDYPGLTKGDLIYAQGWLAVRGRDWGHVAMYIGDFEVTREGGYLLRDNIYKEKESPLRVFRNGKPVTLRKDDRIREGDLIIGAVVEMRWTGAVFNTVDGVRTQASIHGWHPDRPLITWITTSPAPSEPQREEIRRHAVAAVNATEDGLLEWDAGEKHSRDWRTGQYEFDCVTLAEWCYERAGLNLTPDRSEGSRFNYLTAQEQYDHLLDQHIRRRSVR